MTIDEAIEMLECYAQGAVVGEDSTSINAIKLGIEALKEYQKLKKTTFLPIGYKLPGETE